MATFAAPLVVRELETFGAEAVSLIQQNIRSKAVTRFGAMNASGRSAASIRHEVTEREDGLTLTIYGIDYALHLEYGRGPGKFPSLLAIKEWIGAKGIVPKPDAKGRAVSVDSLAYLIGRKIAREGTILHQQKQPSGILADALNGPALGILERKLMPALVEHVTSVLLQAA
ncbi:hypothetical protein HER32_11940 [Hymenobacter sp. BT18]|uniref:hypothetical protein n=1 Tax=Hymenobacter sp. BT18 TaxID=2835648 RepID=UPI00143EB4F8|nr:hypothetical protein [Hymenobacter sp. BT18]QIX61853.1 hypothetical protein HER32_11940 [Hymenobacter sp. BT18]